MAKRYRLRKMTPRECYRLMGVDDDDIIKLEQSGIKDTGHYKLAGNSIVVDCMVHMFGNLFLNKFENKEGKLW